MKTEISPSTYNSRIHLTRWPVTALAEKHREQDHLLGLPGPRRPQHAGDANVRHRSWMSVVDPRYFRMIPFIPLFLTGCMSSKLIYSDGDPSIIGDDCRAKRIKYADHITVTCKDHKAYDGQFIGTECRNGSEVLLLSRGSSMHDGQAPDTQRVAVSSVSEIRYAKADYASAGAVVILSCVGVALVVGLAGGGGWLTIPD